VVWCGVLKGKKDSTVLWCVLKGKKDSTVMALPSSEAVRQTKHVVMAPPGTRPKAVGASKNKKKSNVVCITFSFCVELDVRPYYTYTCTYTVSHSLPLSSVELCCCL